MEEPPDEEGSGLLSRLRSTIGAPGLSFSVRDGKRRNTGAMAAFYSFVLPDAGKHAGGNLKKMDMTAQDNNAQPQDMR